MSKYQVARIVCYLFELECNLFSYIHSPLTSKQRVRSNTIGWGGGNQIDFICDILLFGVIEHQLLIYFNLYLEEMFYFGHCPFAFDSWWIAFDEVM